MKKPFSVLEETYLKKSNISYESQNLLQMEKYKTV